MSSKSQLGFDRKTWPKCHPCHVCMYVAISLTWIVLDPQSFTSLKADFYQDIDRGLHLSDDLMEHFLEGRALLKLL